MNLRGPSPRQRPRAARGAASAALAGLAAVLYPAGARACAVCFSGARDGASLKAYYTVTALMTGAALLLFAGLYFFIIRKYAAPGRATQPSANKHGPQDR